MWVAATDFQKAFDSIHHEAIWRSLRNHSGQRTVHMPTEKSYSNHRATVLTDVESKEFSIARVTKQGDPLSSLFFNSVPFSAMEKDIGICNDHAVGSN